MKKVLAILLPLLLTGFLSTAGTSEIHHSSADTIKIKKVVKRIAKENFYDMTGRPGDVQQINFDLLTRAGSPFDFLKIAMEDKNPVVRLYAFKALARRMDNIPMEVINKFRSDTSQIKVFVNGETKDVPINQIANSFLN